METDECYNYYCENFIKRNGTEFNSKIEAYGKVGKCRFKRNTLNKCGMFEERT